MIANTTADNQWLLFDRGTVTGPFTWEDIVQKTQRREISNKAKIKAVTGKSFEPLSNYIPPFWLYDAEVQALIPNINDAIFFGGVMLFIFAFLLSILYFPIGLLLVILSIGVEIWAIKKDAKEHGTTAMGSVGNVFAILWIIAQIVVTIIIVGLVI